MRTLEGETIADGDLVQNAHGDRVVSRVIFHFKDGSIHDEKAVFSQSGHFVLISDHLIQKGPAFAHPVEMNINRSTGQVDVHYSEKGHEESKSDHMKLPPDLANGLVFTVLKNLQAGIGETQMAYVVATPKPRLVKLVITPQGEEPFFTGEVRHMARHYVVKVDIGGLTGAFAQLTGKQPADTHVWVLEGEAPAFVKSEGPLAMDSPTWRIALVSPTWPKAGEVTTKDKK